MLARMLAAQKEDRRSQDLRDRMDQSTHFRFSETEEGLLHLDSPWTGLSKCKSRSSCARTS